MGLLAIVVLLIGLVLVLVGLLVLVGYTTLGLSGVAPHIPLGAGGALVEGLYCLILGAIFALVGLGLWQQEEWALFVAMLVVIVELLLSLLRNELFWVVVWIILLVYLVLVRDDFS